MNPSILSESREIWRSCEYLLTFEVEGNDFDHSFSQCTIKTCIHPDWTCPCDDVKNLGGVNHGGGYIT